MITTGEIYISPVFVFLQKYVFYNSTHISDKFIEFNKILKRENSIVLIYVVAQRMSHFKIKMFSKMHF